jgi:hypothetical protein
VVRAGRLITQGGALRFVGTEEWVPMWTSAQTRAGFQAFKDLTALFAEEANVVPGDVRIFWIAEQRAVSWCRSTGALYRHDVTTPAESSEGAAAVLPAEALTGGPVGEGGGTASDLRAADAQARAALGN